MSATRRPQVNLAALIGEELGTAPDAPREGQDAPQAEVPGPAGNRDRAPSRAARPRRTAPGERRSAADVIGAPRSAPVLRKPLNVDVPVELDLHTRSHMYRLREGIDIRDQVALALDAWLKERGY